MDNRVTTFAYAKVNLGLAVINRRPDGYHELQSVMQSIGLHDTVSVSLTEGEIECFCGRLSGSENLAYGAAVCFMKGLHLARGAHIEIQKNIPVRAGLGGGSSDAAATLRALNILFKEPYSREELLSLAGELGADVAFCLEGGTQWATGIGERLERLPAAPPMDLVLVKPRRGVNTREAYQVFDQVGNSHPLDVEAWKRSLNSGQVREVLRLLSNDLEQASMRFLPVITRIKSEMLEVGCLAALMSGSGSTVFGVAPSQEHAVRIARRFREKGFDAWETQTIERGDLVWKES